MKLTLTVILLVSIFVILILMDGSVARRKGGKAKAKGGMGNRVPLGGKWRDPDTGAYYMNPQGANITKFSHFDLEFILGHKINFICDARGNPRPEITWFKDGIELYAHHNLQIHEWYFGKPPNETIKSKMEIDPATQMDAGIYECYADNKYAVDKRTFRTDFVTMFD